MMKRISTLIALVFAAGWAMGQLTRADLPNIGDSQYYTAADTAGIVITAGGQGQTWDYSIAQSTGSNVTVNWVDPSTTPQAATYPNANIAYTTSNGDYRFYDLNNDSLVLHGEQSLTGTAIPYTTLCTQLRFPVAFGNSVTDSCVGIYPDGFFFDVTRWGEITTTYDADGTLITPYATYNNVTRIYTNATYRDSSHSGAAETDVYIFRYEWYAPGYPLPVFVFQNQLVSVNAGPFTEQIDIWYADTNLVAIDEPILVNDLNIFPNPADNFAQVSYDLDGDAAVSIELFNTVGERVMTIHEGSQGAGSYTHTIETGSLSQGLYFLKMKAGDSMQTRKLILQ